MRKVLKLDVLSVTRIFVLFYAAIGLYASVQTVLTNADKLYCPFGLDYPYLYFTVNIHFALSEWPGMMVGVLVLIAVMFYAITGAISGATAALAYNLTSRFWPGIAATVEPENAQTQTILQAPVILPADPPPTDLPSN